MQSIYDIEVETLGGEKKNLSEYEGSVLLVVNTASKCGFTPQYAELQKLYDTYKDRGLVILGFPCNQFGSQEPGNNDEINEFCQVNYGVNFPMYAKIDVNGAQTHPLYETLKKQAPGLLGSQGIKWNFTKFLLGRHGKSVERFAPKTAPADLGTKIETLLEES